MNTTLRKQSQRYALELLLQRLQSSTGTTCVGQVFRGCSSTNYIEQWSRQSYSRRRLYSTTLGTVSSSSFSRDSVGESAMMGRIRPRNRNIFLQDETKATTTVKTKTMKKTKENPYTDYRFRYYSSPTSNAFWRDLNMAVSEGDGEGAEDIVMGLLKNYSSSTTTSVPNDGHEDERMMDPSTNIDNEDNDRINIVDTTTVVPKVLDTRIFSLVLQAWKNSRSQLSAERAQQLLDQMIVLYEERILSEPPSLDDYIAVLECRIASGDLSLQSVESAIRIMERYTKDHHDDHHDRPRRHRHHPSNGSETRAYELLLQILGKAGHASKAMILLETLIPKPHSVNMWNSVLEAYLNSNQPDEPPQIAQQVLDRMSQQDRTSSEQQQQQNDFPPADGTSYDLVLQCWARIPEHPDAVSNAQRLLVEMKRNRLQTTLISYQSIISILAHHGEALLAEQFLDDLIHEYGIQYDAQLKPTAVPFETVLLAYTKCHHSDAAPRASSLLTHMSELYASGILERQPDAWSYNFVLKCWMHSSHRDSKDQALKLLKKMQKDGIRPDISTMNTILNIIGTKDGPIQAEQYLNQMYQDYLKDPIRIPQPDVISFGSVLKAWASKKDPQGAEHAQTLLRRLQHLHQSGWPHCQPDLAIFANVMKSVSYSKGNNAPYLVEGIFRSMQESSKDVPDMKPDTVCWNIAISGWAQAGDGPRAEALFQEMLQEYLADRENASAPNVMTFSAVLSAWARTQGNPQAPERAETLLQQMKDLSETGVLPDAKPNVISYSIVLDCLAYARSKSAALRADAILEEMKASDDPNVRPNIVSYNSVMKAWSFSRDPNTLLRVSSLLKEIMSLSENDKTKKFKPNVNTFGSYLKVIADSDIPDREKRAQIVVDLMDQLGIIPNDWTRNQLRRCSNDTRIPGEKNQYNHHSPRGGGGNRFRRKNNNSNNNKNQKPVRSPVPEVPDLNYS